MKIAILSTNYDLGGAAVVTLRLARALQEQGEDVTLVVARPGGHWDGGNDPVAPEDGKTAPDEGSLRVEVVDKWQWRKAFLRELLNLKLRGVSRQNLFKVSTGKYGVALDRHPAVTDADAVIIGWASQGFLDLDALQRILDSGKPVMYIMHDLWPATALCHLPGDCALYTRARGCDACPYVKGARGMHLAKETARRKRELFMHPNLRLVAVSNWQRARAMESTILRGKEVDVIPHPFPVELYTPGEKVGADGRRTIVMAAARLDDPVKDLPTAVDALNTFLMEYPQDARNVEAVFAGELRDDAELKRLRMPWRAVGLTGQEELRRLYSEATVVLSSSKVETMGATLMEGMASGAIPVTFGDGGQTDIVRDGIDGYVAPVHTAASLAFCLSMALQTARDTSADNPMSASRLHASVAARFSQQTIAREVISKLGK